MTTLRLVSNQNQNFLENFGKIDIDGEIVSISLEPWTRALLLRGINKVTLLETSNVKKSVKGKALVGDIYTLEKNNDSSLSETKLIIKVEGENDNGHVLNSNYQNKNSIYINSDPLYDATSEKRKNTLTVGILVLMLLILSTIFGVNQKKRKEFSLESERILQEAILNYEKSVNEVGIDKESSRKFFVDARNGALKLKDSGYKSEKLTSLLNNISSNEAVVLGEKIVDVNEFLDLTLQVSGFSGQSIASSGEEMFIFDNNKKSVVQVDLSTKKAKIVAGKDKLDGVIQIASYEDKLFSLATDGIYQINNEKNKVIDSESDDTSENWSGSLIYLYSANIYMIDKLNNQIFRFSGIPQGKNMSFSGKQDWLAPGVEVDLSKIKDVVIDGSIWLLSNSGKVTKFTNGNPIAISMSGIVDSVTNPTSIYTNEQLKNVYVLEKDKGRIVVLEKDGSYKMQYLSEGLKSALDLVVSEKEGKIILLTGSKLMYLDL